ncbi:hypothetical protein BBBOND_0208800 [Babesia bigemina]|uniref:Uncharacterized protein n=1 Tax=Babesia bigemina TaxID=5866 RepID=A0A061D4V1_BABBI|nr:hypothetical protein BBBOND_0208800 [Babesia bigemina]CDR95726.1 hypothetical protein BBBOND_0208800 [Babesia bigemina]|eukprot:XP_012767912.1 hypothetical protein BBBOND_0208800 [Babesia bigemina]
MHRLDNVLEQLSALSNTQKCQPQYTAQWHLVGVSLEALLKRYFSSAGAPPAICPCNRPRDRATRMNS